MNPSSLSEEENEQAEEAKQRALDILTDALRKKGYVLAENPEDFTHHPKYKDFPLISPSLVRDLIRELQKATFMRSSCNIHEEWVAYVYPQSHEKIIYLCPRFWSNNVLVGIESRPLTVIHEVSHFLGYKHTAEETLDNASNNHLHQRKLLPLATSDIETAFVDSMSHRGTHEFGYYTCCGERARDSVCVKSKMSFHLRRLMKWKKQKDKLKK